MYKKKKKIKKKIKKKKKKKKKVNIHICKNDNNNYNYNYLVGYFKVYTNSSLTCYTTEFPGTCTTNTNFLIFIIFI